MAGSDTGTRQLMQPPEDPRYFYRLELLKGAREWLTANDRLFWRKRADITKSWRDLACARALHDRTPRMDAAHIICELRFADKRRRDPGNWAPTAKAAVDGLVDAGVFNDDNHRIVTGPDMRMGPTVARGWQGVHLLIYPVEKPVKISGEYKQCPICQRPYEKSYPRGTDFTIGRRGKRIVELTPHEDGCTWAADDDRA